MAVGERIRVPMVGTEGAVVTAPKLGDRVRVVLEGVVIAARDRGDRFLVGKHLHANWVYPDADHVVSVEVLPSPEPEWKPGVVVADARGQVFKRAHGARWHSFDGHSLGDDHPRRPLTRLVPEEQS